jgi:hypothetical protein
LSDIDFESLDEGEESSEDEKETATFSGLSDAEDHDERPAKKQKQKQ